MQDLTKSRLIHDNMDADVRNIIRKAASKGACRLSSKAKDWSSLAALFFSPQGREFCKKSNYPDMDEFRNMASHVKKYGVFVEQSVNRSNADTALVGDCGGFSELSFSGLEKVYTVILMHGAKAHVKVGNYAVVRLENINGEYEIDNDGTGRVLI